MSGCFFLSTKQSFLLPHNSEVRKSFNADLITVSSKSGPGNLIGPRHPFADVIWN